MVLALTPRARAYEAFGEGCQLFEWLDGTDRNVPEEVLFEGVAGSGKTRLCCEYVVECCRRYPNSKGLIVRSTRVSLSDSVLPILEEEVLGLGHPALRTGGSREHREFYRHPSLGGTIRLGGLDHAPKLYSTQYDWVWWSEVVDMIATEDAWQRFHRSLRRGTMPYALLFGDANPGPRFHWMNLRIAALEETGVAARLRGRFWDNPLWFDHDSGTWTERGVRYLRKLRHTLTGEALEQLYHGRWSVTSGLIWAEYDAATHEIDGRLSHDDEGQWWLTVPMWPGEDGLPWKGKIRWFFGAHDVGHTAPGCAQVWGVDSENRAYRVAEIYRRGWDHQEWAARWAELDEEFNLEAVVCDHDAAFISALNGKLRAHPAGQQIARLWDKHPGPRGLRAGIDEVRYRLRKRDDGTRGIYFLKNAVRYRDEGLVSERRPWRTEMEIPGYVVREVSEHQAPERAEEPDPRNRHDHGCDATRGAMCYLRDNEGTYTDEVLAFPRGSVNDQLGLNDFFSEHGLA